MIEHEYMMILIHQSNVRDQLRRAEQMRLIREALHEQNKQRALRVVAHLRPLRWLRRRAATQPQPSVLDDATACSASSWAV
ncbi:MAG: hypothetical protein KJ065_02920 [Anaerolineae bacterium]|nr:hypothetical protein [Anaerolineae bacterium]